MGGGRETRITLWLILCPLRILAHSRKNALLLQPCNICRCTAPSGEIGAFAALSHIPEVTPHAERWGWEFEPCKQPLGRLCTLGEILTKDKIMRHNKVPCITDSFN